MRKTIRRLSLLVAIGAVLSASTPVAAVAAVDLKQPAGGIADATSATGAGPTGAAGSGPEILTTGLSVNLEAISAKVAPNGQAAYRAIATTTTNVTQTTFTASLPPGTSYARTLGVTLNNQAATHTVASNPTGVSWSNIAATQSPLNAGSSMEVIFVLNAPALPGNFSVTVSVSANGSSTATDTETSAVTATALTLELIDSPFVVADSNDRAQLIPRVATLGVRAVNPTASAIATTLRIGNGSAPGVFPGAVGATCTSLSAGLAMLALEKHGAPGAASDATRDIVVPAGQTVTTFFSLCYNGTFFQRSTFTAWSDAPGSAPASGEVITQSNISANANKIVSVSGGRSGDVITLTVNFSLGTMGALGNAWIQPAGTYGFDPLVSRLRSAQVTLNGVTQPANRLYFVGLAGSVSGTAEYTFDVIGFGLTTLSPYVLAASGQPLKFTGNFGESTTVLTPPSLSATKRQRNYPAGTFTADPISVSAGDVIEYEITVSNSGQQEAMNVDVTDAIPALTTYVPGSASDGGALSGGNVVWDDKTVAALGSITLTFRVQVSAVVPLAFQVENQASATSDNGGNPTTNTVVANGSGVVDLTLSKSCPSTVVLGEQATITLTFGNTGSTAATNVTISDSLSSGQSYVPGSTSGAAEPSQTGQTLTFALGTVAAGASGQVSFSVTVTGTGSISDTATISGNEPDVDTTDNTASCASTVTQPDLAIATSCPIAPVRGETATYTLTWSNTGTAAALGATIVDTLGAGQSYVPGSASGAFESVAVSGSQITFGLIDPLPAGASGQITFDVLVTGSGTLSNSASISGSRQEANTANNTSSCSSGVTVPDLWVAKACPASGVLGEAVAYTLDFGNSGSASEPSATLTDTLSGGQTYNAGSASTPPSSVTVNPNGTTTLVWSLGTLSAGASGRITFRATVTGTGSISNSASIAGTRQETNSSNNTAACTITVTYPDLHIAKQCPQTAAPGAVVTHTLTFGNSGSADALGVTITDVIGSGQSYVAGSASAPVSVNGNTLTFTLGAVGAAGTGQITYQVRVADANSAGQHTYTDSATISGSRQEIDLADNSATCATNVTYRPDLGIAKHGTDVQTAPGATIGFVITVTNPDATSSAPATSVVVTDSLPAETSFVSCGGAPCAHANGTVTWTVGTVGIGQTVTLTLEVLVGINAGCQICNTATASSPSDPDSPLTTAPSCVAVSPHGNAAFATATGSAFGLDATILGLHPDAPVALPVGGAGSGQSGPGQDVPDATHVHDVVVPGLASAKTFVSTSSSNVSGAGRTSHGTTTATVTELSLLDGVITADVVRAVAQADSSDGSAGLGAIGSAFKNLKVNGVPVKDVTPNQRVDLKAPDGSAIGYAILFEQIETVMTPPGLKNGTYLADLTVNMIHVFLATPSPLGPAPGTEIVVAHAAAHADFPQAERCSQGSSQSVGGNGSSLRAILGGGSPVEIVKGASGPIPESGGSSRQNLVDIDTPIGTIDVSRSGADGINDGTSQADAFDQVQGLFLLDGLVTAGALESWAHSTAGPAGAVSDDEGTRFADVLVAGVPIAHQPAPNSVVVEMPGIGFAILNEQIESSAAGSSGIVVTAIHLVVTSPDNELGIAPGSEIWISQARTSAAYATGSPNLLP